MMQSITRKEAIEILKDLLDCSYVDSFEPEENEALSMAIKALEQEPTTKNDLGVDCVDRNKAYEIIESWAKTFDSGTYFDNEQVQEIIMACANRIDELPSVTPQEPKTGHWIATGAYYTGAYGSIDYVECSCCHYESLEEGDFCPNCGAKMVEPQESER